MIEQCNRVAIIGLGLIGGSIGSGLKQSGFVGEIVGYAPHHGPQALSLGLIDRFTVTAQEAVVDADLVVIATPPSLIVETISLLACSLKDSAVVTDVGSTKASIVQAVSVALNNSNYGGLIARFVPGHPIAGSEENGPVAANPALFCGATVILTPIEQTLPWAIAKVQQLWSVLGARTQLMTPADHDRRYALVSHLPHWAAFALAHALATQADANHLLAASGAGLKDTTRIAGSTPQLWVDIFSQNKTAILASIASYQRSLDAMKHDVMEDDYAALADKLRTASEWRRDLRSSQPKTS